MRTKKQHNKTYYYRTKRIDGRVTTEYLGPATPELDARSQALSDRRQAERAFIERHDRFNQTYNEIQKQIDLLITAHMLINGCHKHHGQWRKRRKPKQPSNLASPPATPPPSR